MIQVCDIGSNCCSADRGRSCDACAPRLFQQTGQSFKFQFYNHRNLPLSQYLLHTSQFKENENPHVTVETACRTKLGYLVLTFIILVFVPYNTEIKPTPHLPARHAVNSLNTPDQHHTTWQHVSPTHKYEHRTQFTVIGTCVTVEHKL